MSDETSVALLKGVFRRTFPLAKDSTSSTLGDEHWDSLKHIELVSAIEDEFELELSMEDVRSLKDFSSALKLVSKSD